MNLWKRLKNVVTKFIPDKYFFKWLFFSGKSGKYSIRLVLLLHLVVLILQLSLIIFGKPDPKIDATYGFIVNLGLFIFSLTNYYNLYIHLKKRNWDILKR